MPLAEEEKNNLIEEADQMVLSEDQMYEKPNYREETVKATYINV